MEIDCVRQHGLNPYNHETLAHMPWAYYDPTLGHVILKSAPFAHRVRKYDAYTQSYVYELMQGLPFTLPAAWDSVEVRGETTIATLNARTYDITEIVSATAETPS